MLGPPVLYPPPFGTPDVAFLSCFGVIFVYIFCRVTVRPLTAYLRLWHFWLAFSGLFICPPPAGFGGLLALLAGPLWVRWVCPTRSIGGWLSRLSCFFLHLQFFLTVTQLVDFRPTFSDAAVELASFLFPDVAW